MNLLTADHISMNFGKKPVLTDVYLTVDRGEIVTLIGPNGAGKSTLVRIVLGLIKPSKGEIRRADPIKIGYMPQKLQIDSYLPISVERFLQLAGGHEIPDKKNFRKVVQEIGIDTVLKSAIQEISGGELQRVLLARAILRHPDLLVLDEPVQGVDIIGQEELYRLIMRLRDLLNCGILMVSHDLHLVMAGTDSVICLNEHVCCSGRPEDVSRHPEFINLFGITAAKGIAVYAHQHDHRHD